MKRAGIASGRAFLGVLGVLAAVASGCSHGTTSSALGAREVKPGPKELHFAKLTQLTFEGTHAEAYFSPDGKKLIFQGRPGPKGCDQIFVMNVDGTDRKAISTRGGRTTCSFFSSNDQGLFSSTHEAGSECPAERDRSKGYVWEIYKSYDIYATDLAGGELRPLTRSPGYDAESTVCGDLITFTSARDGNALHVYTMKTDGSDVRRLTSKIGYNGGPFFSKDCSRIVYRAYHPQKKSERKAFEAAVAEGYVPPSNLEIFVMSREGSQNTQLTELHAASFAPSFFPDGKKVIFSTSLSTDPQKRSFQLYEISAHEARQKKPVAITSEGSFNGFPMFSPDGKHLVFASNRNSENPHLLQIFLAEWKD